MLLQKRQRTAAVQLSHSLRRDELRESDYSEPWRWTRGARPSEELSWGGRPLPLWSSPTVGECQLEA